MPKSNGGGSLFLEHVEVRNLCSFKFPIGAGGQGTFWNHQRIMMTSHWKPSTGSASPWARQGKAKYHGLHLVVGCRWGVGARQCGEFGLSHFSKELMHIALWMIIFFHHQCVTDLVCSMRIAFWGYFIHLWGYVMWLYVQYIFAPFQLKNNIWWLPSFLPFFFSRIKMVI